MGWCKCILGVFLFTCKRFANLTSNDFFDSITVLSKSPLLSFYLQVGGTGIAFIIRYHLVRFFYDVEEH